MPLKHLLLSNPSQTRYYSSSRGRNTPNLVSAFRTHGFLIKSRKFTDTYTWNNVLADYCRWSELDDAQKLFDEIPQRDIVSWNSLIAGYVLRGSYEHACLLFGKMLHKRLFCNQYTLGSVLKSVSCSFQLVIGNQLHSFVVKTGLDRNVFSGSALVDMYAKCGSLSDAHLAFKSIAEPNTVSWNTIISGYAKEGDASTAYLLFCQMEREGLKPDESSFASLLPLLNDRSCYKVMVQVHAKIIKFGWVVDAIVYNAAITAYSECQSIIDSKKVFEDMVGIRDLVTWNSMLAAYADHGFMGDAVKLFMRMQDIGIAFDIYTFTSVISACFECGQISQGRILHALVVKSGMEGAPSISNALIGMYIRSNDICNVEDAVKCFNSIEFRDAVSWNSILTGFSQNGFSEDALKFFCHMQAVSVRIDHYAFSATLRSCSDLAVLQFGQQVHGLVLKSGFGSNDFVSSSLIYLYSKCGIIVDAKKSFDESCKDSSVIWNSIIFGYAQHGLGEIALDLFHKMQELGVKADHITFVGLLSACSHSGLVKEGSKILKSIQPTYGIPLRMEHYACGVDLFGRAGNLTEAKDLIESMPFEPDSMVWMTLLGACRIHGNMDLASHIAKSLLESEPTVHSTYVILSNMYAGFGYWDGRAMIQRAMRDRGVTKVPGWSWIEVNKKLHSFNAEDRSHPQSGEIYDSLATLMEEVEIVHYECIEVGRHEILFG
ncbi:putative pentatricopeptide repeat-containing protein At3g25970 [Dendrobium catenatum]|uniref:Pentatricopeptide repeat-containing protein n=1 Tax=Dendrobium catenatum TaxID=906689 RepID=A0A2I0WJU0_9ASPA|nr:putative pentatricopeptide repeat-containing protein At3g25970 [Dendrobium catenatum]PKU75927.1 Putative pentatricopeptide repeat-containing protein [Dendrobium catenatum]